MHLRSLHHPAGTGAPHGGLRAAKNAAQNAAQNAVQEAAR
jgi:hypothetical protein